MSQNTDLNSSLLNTIFLTFSHNEFVIAFALATLLSAYLVFIKPSRYHVLLLFGYAILVLSYEYEKHISIPLTEQTLKSLAPVPGTHLRTQQYVNTFLSIFLPVGIFVTGWLLIFWAMLIGGKNER